MLIEVGLGVVTVGLGWTLWRNPTRVMMGQGANNPPVPPPILTRTSAVLMSRKSWRRAEAVAMRTAEPKHHDSRDPNKP